MHNEIINLICDKLLDDGLLLEKVNELNLKYDLDLISKSYIKTVLDLVSRKRCDLIGINYSDMDIGIYGGIIYRQMKMPMAGDVIKSHKHNYDHFTYIEKGIVDINGEIYKAGQWAKVPKDTIHTIKALTNNCITYCINSEHEAMEHNE